LAEKGIAAPTDDRIPRRPAGTDRAPLSFAQEAMWFLEQLEPGAATHNQPSAVRLVGELDAAALGRALGEIVRRHEPLRTTFTTDGGKPYQVIAPATSLERFALEQIDLTRLDASAAGAEGLRLAAEEAQRAFDLETGPLFRAILIRIGAREHILTLNSHHIVTDGWSMGVFTRELDQLYRAFRAGEPSPLEELPVQLADFAVWQREHLEGEVAEGHLAYWKEHLAGELPSLTFPPDRPRPKVRTFRGGHRTVRLSSDLSDALRALSRRRGVTPFMTLNAAFHVLLFDACRETDVVIGSAVAHRNRKELEGMIAFLVNMLVMRTDLSGNPTFGELQQRVQKVTLGAWNHQDLPLSWILREIAPERDLARNPLFQVQFSLLTPDHNPAVYGYGLGSGDIETLSLPGLVMTPVDVQYENARYDVAVFLWDMPQGIQGTIEYSSDLYDPGTIAKLAERYEAVLRAIVRRPDARLEELAGELAELDRRSKAAAAQSFEATARKKLGAIKRRRSGGSS
jgi:hypothetical protein